MNKEELFKYFCSIFDELLTNTFYFRNYFQSPYCVVDEPYRFNNFISLVSGATRGVLIDNRIDYVAKFNLMEEASSHFDWCQQEADVYEIAKNCDFDKYFPETFYLGTYEKTIEALPGFELYTSEEEAEEDYVNSSASDFCQVTIKIPLYASHFEAREGYHSRTFSKERAKELEKYASPLTKRNKEIGLAFEEKYGEEEFRRFSRFLRAVRCDDLHNGNAYFNVNGDFKIIDFAGFFSNPNIL